MGIEKTSAYATNVDHIQQGNHEMLNLDKPKIEN